jgi:hypothetical protein
MLKKKRHIFISRVFGLWALTAGGVGFFFLLDRFYYYYGGGGGGGE